MDQNMSPPNHARHPPLTFDLMNYDDVLPVSPEDATIGLAALNDIVSRSLPTGLSRRRRHAQLLERVAVSEAECETLYAQYRRDREVQRQARQRVITLTRLTQKHKREVKHLKTGRLPKLWTALIKRYEDSREDMTKTVDGVSDLACLLRTLKKDTDSWKTRLDDLKLSVEKRLSDYNEDASVGEAIIPEVDCGKSLDPVKIVYKWPDGYEEGKTAARGEIGKRKNSENQKAGKENDAEKDGGGYQQVTALEKMMVNDWLTMVTDLEDDDKDHWVFQSDPVLEEIHKELEACYKAVDGDDVELNEMIPVTVDDDEDEDDDEDDDDGIDLSEEYFQSVAESVCDILACSMEYSATTSAPLHTPPGESTSQQQPATPGEQTNTENGDASTNAESVFDRRALAAREKWSMFDNLGRLLERAGGLIRGMLPLSGVVHAEQMAARGAATYSAWDPNDEGSSVDDVTDTNLLD